jgi:GxxExxY protein
MTENEIARQVVDVAYKVHTHFGPGLLESVYESIMAYELRKRGLCVETQQGLPVIYEDLRMDVGFRPDLIVAGKVIVEIKSVEAVTSGPQENAVDLSARCGFAAWAAGKFRRSAHQEWHNSNC